MSSLLTHALAFAWPAAPSPVFADVRLHLEPGWTSLVGPNGAGKTTLLRLLAGQLVPTAGGLDVPAPAHLCEQEVGVLSDAIQAFAWGHAGLDPWAWQARLDLDPADLDRWPTLSPGERKRWQLGTALASGARTLLLDEPTNHLDATGRALISTALAAFDGIGLVVSHDQAFLDGLCAHTVEVRGGQVRRFPGRLSDALAAWRLQDQQARERADQLSQTARAAQRRLHDARAGAASADRNTSSRSRMKNNKDSDARSTAAKARAAFGAARAGHQTRLARRDADAANAAATAAAPGAAPVGRSLFLHHQPAPRELLLSRTGAPIVAGSRTLLTDVHLALHRGDHVHLAGDNGAGKTTLLRTLLADAELPADKVLHLPQDLSATRTQADLDLLADLPPEDRGRVLQVVAALGVPPGRLLDSQRPSPGEARKLALALGMGRQAWLLVLDEPTNHLDLPSIRRLAQALAEFPGALLLVSHDPVLAEATCQTRWLLADDRVEVGPVLTSLSPRLPP